MGGGVKVMCITRGRPIGLHHPIALHHLHSAPAAEAYLAPFIMHGHHPPPPTTHKPVMARSLRQLSRTLLFPLRGCERLHNLEAARCFQGSSLIKNVTDWISGGVFSKGGNARCSTWDNGRRRGPKLRQLFFFGETFGDVSIMYGWLPTYTWHKHRMRNRDVHFKLQPQMFRLIDET